MTSIGGYNTNTVPCGGKNSRPLRYRSMIFSAREYLTDGHTEGVLMPNCFGLPKCLCGAFYLRREMVDLGKLKESELDHDSSVQADDLPNAIAKAQKMSVELAARLEYWHSLSQSHRDIYRAHHNAEEADAQAAWCLTTTMLAD